MTPTTKATAEAEPTLTDQPEGADVPGTAVELSTRPGALALPVEDPWADVDSGYMGHHAVGLSLPLLQSDMRPGGGWVDQMTGEKLASLDIVWLAWTESRAFWLEPFGKGSKQPDCRSTDTQIPDEASPERQAATCAECPHSKWSGEDPPACGLRVNVLAYLVGERRLTRVSFGGTALKYVSKYIGGLRAMVPPRPPMAFVTHVELEQVEEPGGSKWLEPRFTVAAEVDRSEAAPLIALRDEFTAQWRSLLAEDLAKPESGAEHNRPGPGPFEDAVETSSRDGDPSWPTTDDEPLSDDEPDF